MITRRYALKGKSSPRPRYTGSQPGAETSGKARASTPHCFPKANFHCKSRIVVRVPIKPVGWCPTISDEVPARHALVPRRPGASRRGNNMCRAGARERERAAATPPARLLPPRRSVAHGAAGPGGAVLGCVRSAPPRSQPHGAPPRKRPARSRACPSEQGQRWSRNDAATTTKLAGQPAGPPRRG